jgi:ribosome-associated protein
MKGEDIVLLDLIGICSFADYFLFCTGTSDRMLKALSDEVQKTMKQAGLSSIQGLEGEANTGWILHDYGDVILHLFSPERREYY